MMTKPKLTFFCELDAQNLSQLFDGRFLIDDLLGLDATLSLGIRDLSDERANVVKRLNKAGLPVIAWLLLPEEQGYWFNNQNYEHAAARYVAFKAWTAQHDLKWAGIGLDIEMDVNDTRQIMEKRQIKPFISKLFHRYLDRQQALKAHRNYQALVELIHADGYLVEAYHIPLISEERRGKSSVLQRTLGLVDLNTDREVLMLYTSFMRPNGEAILWSYAPDADAIGVGSTGGGVDIQGVIDLEPLSWDEFSRDLRLCAAHNKPIYIFSLEGCAAQGFLTKLNQLDWGTPVTPPQRTGRVNAIRTAIAAGLWLLERPWVILISILSFVGLGFLFKQSNKSRVK
jgi:hypothetical protein